MRCVDASARSRIYNTRQRSGQGALGDLGRLEYDPAVSDAEALLLGIVQGLTEFLPISSSGHLILVPWLQDYRFLLDHPDFNKTFDVALHFGTLIAAITYFRHEVVRFTRGFIRAARRRTAETVDERLAVALAIGPVPAVIFGGLGEIFFEDHVGEPWMI